MAGHRVLQSPVLVGRDDLLDPASDLRQSSDPRLQALGELLSARLRDLPAADGDRHGSAACWSRT